MEWRESTVERGSISLNFVIVYFITLSLCPELAATGTREEVALPSGLFVRQAGGL